MPAMTAGHEHATCRSAYRRAGVELVELHAFLRELVQVWRFDLLLAVRPDLAHAEIVRINKNDIRFALLRLRGAGRGGQHAQEDQEVFHNIQINANAGSNPLLNRLRKPSGAYKFPFAANRRS